MLDRNVIMSYELRYDHARSYNDKWVKYLSDLSLDINKVFRFVEMKNWTMAMKGYEEAIIKFHYYAVSRRTP